MSSNISPTKYTLVPSNANVYFEIPCTRIFFLNLVSFTTVRIIYKKYMHVIKLCM